MHSPTESRALSPHLSPTPTMASTPLPQKGRDVVLPTLDVLIQALNIAKDVCGIPPAQIALGSASTLLTMIRVRPPPLYSLRKDELLTHVYLGHHGQLRGLRRARAELRECMSGTPPEIGGETTGRADRGGPRCDWRLDWVSPWCGC